MTVSFVPCKQCPDQCEPVFDRVVVSYLVAGHSKVMWELLPTFTDPQPYAFQLQWGRTTDPDADDWADVGGPVTNVYFAYDPEQRVFGKENWAYYRVKVTTPLGSYVSLPADARGTLSKRDWLKARNLARRVRTQSRLGEAQEGYLLRRRVAGTPCQTCLDFITREPRQGTDCPECYGTGFSCGYFYPQGCTWAKILPKAYRASVDGQMRGTVNDVVVQAQNMIVDGFLNEDDVYVAKITDERYYVHKVQHTAEIRGAGVLANVELRPIPYSSRIYQIEIPDQLLALGLTP